MDNLESENASERLLLKSRFCITIENGAIDKKSIDENKRLLKTLSALVKKKWVFIYIAVALYIVHFISINVFMYRLIIGKYDTGDYDSDISGFYNDFTIVMGILLVCIVILIGCLIFCKTNYITLRYRLDETSKQTVDTNNSAFEILSQCKKLWGVSDYNVGSYSTIHPIRKDAQLQYKSLPWFLKSNIDKCYQLHTRVKNYYFLPEKILIESKKGVTSAYYPQIKIKLDKEVIAETGFAPRDAMFYGNTWEHVNKDGSPDKRVKNNRQIPEYLYGIIHFRGDEETKLDLKLYCSDIRKVADAMKILSSTNTYKEEII